MMKPALSVATTSSLWAALLSILLLWQFVSSYEVTYDQRSFLIDGKRHLILSGSIHYTRIPRADWEQVILKAKRMGLNTIQTYVFWNEHEPYPHMDSENWMWGSDGSSNKDLPAFLSLVAQHNMFAVVRLGPYACAEYHFGGLPLWLRQTGADCFRCMDPIWKREMERYTSIVLNKLQPFLENGPVIALQIENEYDHYDEYLEWTIAMAHNQTEAVPWFICHAVPACMKLEDHPALCAINGFWMDRGGGTAQPGTEFFEALWSHAPEQPAMWTEDQGWFDVWGRGHVVRIDPLYGMARFFAMGGSFHNLYMFTGGNNYGYSAGRRGVTAYAPDTVVDSFLLRHEPKYDNYQSLFTALHRYEDDILSQPPAFHGTFLSKNVTVHEYGRLIFLTNLDVTNLNYAQYRNESYALPPRSIVLVDVADDKRPTVVFNSSSVVTPKATVSQSQFPLSIELKEWNGFAEPFGYGSITNTYQESPEQLNITENLSDYLYYSFQLPAELSGSPITIEPAGAGGIYYIYVDGQYTARVEFGEFDETKRDQTILPPSRMQTQRQLKDSSSASDVSNVTILSVAMGLNNFGISPNSGKGIKSVSLDDHNVTISKFATAWKLKGEELQIYSHKGSANVAWFHVCIDDHRFFNTSLVWFQSTFDVPVDYRSFVGSSQPEQTAMVANLTGLNKGILYVNGVHLGRYWLVRGECESAGGDNCAPPHHGTGACMMKWSNCGQPTQELYHIPFELLRETGNLLTVMEETFPEVGPRNLTHVRVELIDQHPY